MKKHSVIIGIVALSALFFIPALIKNSPESKESSKPKGTTTLNERMEKMGRSLWNEEDYDALMNEIIGLASDQQISVSELNSYRNTLNINLQKSLVLSYKKSLNESCYAAGLTKVKQVSNKIANPIPELSIQKQQYKKFQIALNYKAKLMALLAKQYNASEANNLKQNFYNAITNHPFYNCNIIQELKNKIEKELKDFESFDIDYGIVIKNQQNFVYYEIYFREENYNKLQKYAYYKNEYETLKHQQ